MARYFKSTILIITMLMGISLSSCDNSEDIGDLLGMWRLDEITYKGETTYPTDLFLCFQSNYVAARHGAGNPATGHYTNSNGIMQMTFYYADGTYPENPSTDPNNPATYLTPFKIFDDDTPQTEENIRLGINPVNITFTVETLNSSKMILTNADGRWCFTKY